MMTTPENNSEQRRYAITAAIYAAIFFALACICLVATFVVFMLYPAYFSPKLGIGFIALAAAGLLILSTAGHARPSAIATAVMVAGGGALGYSPGMTTLQAVAAASVLFLVGILGLVIASAKFSLRELVGDGIILLICSSVFVIVCNKSFDSLKKKGSESDTLTTAITQQSLERVQKIFDEKEYANLSKEEKLDSYQAYCNSRVGRRDQFGRTPLMWAAYANFSDIPPKPEKEKTTTTNAENSVESRVVEGNATKVEFRTESVATTVTETKSLVKTEIVTKVRVETWKLAGLQEPALTGKKPEGNPEVWSENKREVSYRDRPEAKKYEPKRRKADDSRRPIVKFLVDVGADVNAKDNDGWTPLLWASWSGLPQVAEELVAKGADLSVLDAKGNSALGLAAQRGNVAVVKMLLAKGAKPSEQDRQVLEKAKAEYPRRAAVYEEIQSLLASK